jgi:NAD(P)-dependent dehydrogenase (short-subunit alcohol dehydrogenase family)
MKGNTVLITGGNAGIGKHTAIGLAKKGAKVIIVARDKKKGEMAVLEIKKASNSDTVSLMIADLSSFDSVRQLALDFQKENTTLDVLINNAGAFFTEYGATVDGFERQWQINHLSGFLLTHLLLENIKVAKQGRIVNVSSKGHYNGFLYFKDLNRQKKYVGLAAYAQSKLANVMFSNSLTEVLKDTNVTVNSLHPGVVKTSIGDKNNSSWVGAIWKLGKLFMISEEEGAKTSIFLASDPSVTKTSGRYFDKCRAQAPNPSANDKDKLAKLWEVSMAQTGLAV